MEVGSLLSYSHPLAGLQRCVVGRVHPAPFVVESGNTCDNVLSGGLELYVNGNSRVVGLPEFLVKVLVEQLEAQGNILFLGAVAEGRSESALRAVDLVVCRLYLVEKVSVVKVVYVISRGRYRYDCHDRCGDNTPNSFSEFSKHLLSSNISLLYLYTRGNIYCHI